MTNTLTTVATPPYWCTSMVNKLVASFAWNMVLCMIVGCGSKSGRDKGLYFARVPSVLANQGEEAQELSKERRSRWISAISRDDLTEEILRPGQTLATFQRNILQHCCMMLLQLLNGLAKRTQHFNATCRCLCAPGLWRTRT